MDENIGELIEKLAIANIKLFNLCDLKAAMAKNPDSYTKQEMAEVFNKDVTLCNQRGALKNKINKFFGVQEAEVKSYGK